MGVTLRTPADKQTLQFEKKRLGVNQSNYSKCLPKKDMSSNPFTTILQLRPNQAVSFTFPGTGKVKTTFTAKLEAMPTYEQWTKIRQSFGSFRQPTKARRYPSMA